MDRRLVVAMGVALALALAGAGPASASEAIDSFSVTTSSTQAGGHPDLGMSFTLDSPGAPEAAKEVSVNAPEGVFGNPNAITKCNAVDFALDRCSSASQAGLITIRANYSAYGGSTNELLGTAPIFSRYTVGDQTGLFSFVVPSLKFPVSLPVAVRTGSDFGLRFTVQGLTQLTPLAGADITFWGFPADEANDDDRFPQGSTGNPPGCPGLADASCSGPPVDAAITVQPLIDSPSACTGADLPVSIIVTTYQDPANPSHDMDFYPGTTGCYAMTFKPVLFGTTTTTEADSPSGLDLTLETPQPLGEATTPSPIKEAVLTLPEGLTVNPDAADGQGMCLDSQANFGNEREAACPDRAKIGTFAVGSPSLDGPLEGSIYIGEPKPGDQYRLFLIADGFGIHAKFVTSIVPDPLTGQVTAYISGLPHVPFEEFQLHLFASDRGLMATPTNCTLYPVVARFFPWNDKLPDVVSTQFFPITSGPQGSPCPGQVRPFHPRLVAGTLNPQAGGYSNFNLKLDRDDGDQFLKDINFTMPPGFTGNLRGISYCPEASIAAAAQRPGRSEQASPSCPAASEIGASNVAAGPGGHPFHATGRIFMAGPLKGAPLSLVVVTPALAGPYDYGTIVVRVALHVDPLTAQVRALSDTVPQIVGGIPIRLRSIEVNINRSQFTINPTNCDPKTVDSQGVGDQGTVVDFSSYFRAVNCATLPFKPKMTVRRFGRKGTLRGQNPGLRFDLRTRAGDANIRSISVTLSHAFEIDQRHLGNICSEKELVASQCAGRTPIGQASTTTPLLDQALSGPAYAVSGSGGLPRLAFILNGQVNLMPRADTRSTRTGQLQTTVPVVPDAPIGHFRLDVLGGKTGYLINTRSLCVHPPVVTVDYKAQNGKTRTDNVRVKAACGKRKARAKR